MTILKWKTNTIVHSIQITCTYWVINWETNSYWLREDAISVWCLFFLGFFCVFFSKAWKMWLKYGHLSISIRLCSKKVATIYFFSFAQHAQIHSKLSVTNVHCVIQVSAVKSHRRLWSFCKSNILWWLLT